MNKNKETKVKKSNFTISINDNLKDRIQYLRKIYKSKNNDLYLDIEKLLFKYIEEKEKRVGVDSQDHKKIALCPKCNCQLRIVKTKTVDFIGCTNYPKCKYTASIK